MVIIPTRGGFSKELWERYMGKDDLEEMAGLRKGDSGLPVNLWLDDSGAYIRGGHAKRIKFQGDHGNKTNGNNLFTMIISKDNPEIPKDQLPKVKLSAKDTNAIKAFVMKNADLLGKLADQEISFFEFCKRMKK